MKKHWIFVAVLLLVGLVALEATAGPINGCVNKNTGVLRISDKCKSNERSISLQAESGFTGPNVIDANGQDLGILVSVREYSLLMFNPNSNQFFVLFPKDGKTAYLESLEAFIFESWDCTGVPYAQGFGDIDKLLPSKMVYEKNGKYYSAMGDLKDINAGSKLDYDNVCLQAVYICEPHYCPGIGFIPISPNNDKYLTTISESVMPIQGVTVPFTPPITLPLSFK